MKTFVAYWHISAVKQCWRWRYTGYNYRPTVYWSLVICHQSQPSTSLRVRGKMTDKRESMRREALCLFDSFVLMNLVKGDIQQMLTLLFSIQWKRFERSLLVGLCGGQKKNIKPVFSDYGHQTVSFISWSIIVKLNVLKVNLNKSYNVNRGVEWK